MFMKFCKKQTKKINKPILFAHQTMEQLKKKPPAQIADSSAYLLFSTVQL